MRHPAITAIVFGIGLAGTAPAQQGDGKPPTPPQDETPKTLQVGDTVPEDLQLVDTTGKPFRFGDARGRAVAIHFWSIKCPWEKAAEPRLMQLAKDLVDKDAIVVAIAANQDEIGAQPKPEDFANEDAKARPYANLRSKAEAVAFNHRILVDHGGTVAKLLQAKTTPHCFVVDGKGVLVYSGALDDGTRGEPTKHYLRDAVDAALAGKPVEPATTRPYG